MKTSDDDFLLYLRETVTDALAATSDKEAVVSLIIDKVSFDWGSQRIYITKRNKWQLDERDRQLYKKFNGRNRHALCREFGIGEVHFYNIIKRVQEEMQVDLFKEDGEMEKKE